MQHLDEGTIHAWLDGALTPEEASRAAAHVQECAQCQAAVAEARGFIAASSRILTALDDAPRGVIPASTPKRRVQPWIWRVAATVLVVATGTVLLVKQRGSERTNASRLEVGSSAPATVPVNAQTSADSTAAAASAADQMAPAPNVARAARPLAAEPALIPSPIRATAKRVAASGNAEKTAATSEGRADASDSRSNSAPPTSNTIAPIAAPTPLAGRVFGSAGGGAGRVQSAPREVATTRTVGRTQTFYEIAPGDTVVLEEQSSVQLQSAVVTGAPMARQAQAQAARTNKAAAAAPVEPQQKAEAAVAAPPPAPPVAALQDAPTGGRHSISWLDPTTRRVVILSGRHSQEELQRIREQIQRLRDVSQPTRNPQ